MVGSAGAQTAVRSETRAELDADLVACTMEARQCPDGSFVGRTVPNCEFAACPGDSMDDPAVKPMPILYDEGQAAPGGNSKGNVEYEWKVEEGERMQPPPDGPTDVMMQNDGMMRKESGEKAGTADINIGVGEMQDGGDDGDMDMRRGSDGSMKSDVAVRAVEVRGWDPEKKAEFLSSVKAHAELRSGQDLDNFARGILIEDENVDEVQIAEEGVAMSYRVRGKFLGVVDLPMRARSQVYADGRVKVKYPWYSFLFADYVPATDIENDVRANAGDLSDWVVLSEEGVARTGGVLVVLHQAFAARAN